MHAERPALFYRARNQTVHHGRGTGCGSDGQRDSPTVARTGTSNFLEDISSNSDCVSVKAMSGATSYFSASNAAKSAAHLYPSMFFQRKLPVSLSSCITLSLGEIMTVVSSISLQASAGFFCHRTEAAFIREEPPRTRRFCGTPACTRRWNPRHGREYPEAADWLQIQRKRTARWGAGREASPRGEGRSRDFPGPVRAGRAPGPERSYSSPQREIRPRKESRMRATRHFRIVAAIFRPSGLFLPATAKPPCSSPRPTCR